MMNNFLLISLVHRQAKPIVEMIPNKDERKTSALLYLFVLKLSFSSSDQAP